MVLVYTPYMYSTMTNYTSASSHHQLQGPTLFNSPNGHTRISGGTFILNYTPHNEIKAAGAITFYRHQSMIWNFYITAGIESALFTNYFVPSATHDTNEVPNPPQ